MGGRILPAQGVEGEFEGTYLTAWYYRGGCAVHCILVYQPCYGCRDGNRYRFYSGAVGIWNSQISYQLSC